MPSLEDEFKKLLGEKYPSHIIDISYKNIFSNDSNKCIDNLLDIYNSQLNKEFQKRSNDFVNLEKRSFQHINPYTDQLPEQQISNSDIREDINKLLKKMDKIIEQLDLLNIQIDKKIQNTIDERFSKREYTQGQIINPRILLMVFANGI